MAPASNEFGRLASLMVRRSRGRTPCTHRRAWNEETFAAFVGVATIAGSLAATPASAQRGVAAPGRYYEPPLTEQAAGHTTILAVANG